MFALLDASVIFAGVVGRGESSLILATIRLGGLDAFTTENAMEEARRNLIGYFNRKRLKVHATEADRELKALREAPTFTIVPWVTAEPSLLPDNRKDAYLIDAVRRYRPRILLTLDHKLFDLEAVDETVVASPKLLLTMLDLLENGDL